MAIPDLDSLTARLDRTCVNILGETIAYAPNGAGPMSPAPRGHVDYRDAIRALDNAQVFEQDITVSILKADVATKPTGAARLQLARISGITFRPINVRTDESGTHWEFEVQITNA